MDELETERLQYIKSIGKLFAFDTKVGEYILAPNTSDTFRTHQIEWILEELRDLNMQQSFEFAEAFPLSEAN